MASKSDLEAREAECRSVEDFVNLAREALTDPADKDYAKELLQKAEMQCQMPLDYLKAADAAAGELGDRAVAKDIYDQAEEMLFEVPEFIGFAHSMAAFMGDQEKARETLQTAADQASQLPDFLAIARVAKQDLGDEELSKTLLAKVEGKAKSVEDFRDLASKVKQAGDTETARTLFKKAARFCDDIPATVNYARDVNTLFEDKDWARQILDEAETECQFTKQFVQLAEGYKDLFDDMDKVNELIDQAAEFCMSGEEQVDLADGYWNLLKNKQKAAESYQKALSEITDKQALLDLAKKAAIELESTDLAKTVYAKAEQRMSSAAELSKLAQAVVTDLKDKGYAAEIYTRAADSLANPKDLMNLAGDIYDQLEDNDHAASVYRKAFDKTGDFKQLLDLVDQVNGKLGDRDFAREILEKAEQSGQESPPLVAVAGKVLSVLGDKAVAARVLETAEECVTTLGEMKTVTETVKKNFADNAAWIKRVEEKLTKRQANQAKYNAFQDRENRAESQFDYLKLADSVMVELKDKYYTHKLLTSAEQAYEDQGYDFNQGRELVLAINKHLNDKEWIERLLDEAAERCANFLCVHQVGQTAKSDLSNKAFGKKLAKRYYKNWEKKLDGADVKSAYDYTKLAHVIGTELGERKWAGTLIDKAVKIGGDQFAYAQMGLIASEIGAEEKTKALYQSAQEACQGPAQLQQLALRMKTNGVEAALIREFYADAKSRLETPNERLTWVEGIVQVFQDKAWADSEYDELASQFKSAGDVARINASRRSRLQTGLW